MDAELLVAHGNHYREINQPEQALSCYAQAFVQDFNNAHAWNNYGNVIREMGFPERSIPFLQQAAVLNPDNITTHFNLAVSYLLMGDYARGWPQYEWRWKYEHLNGTMPTHTQPQWTGQDLTNKTILVIGEQGHGDCIQFSRFILDLKNLGANVLFQVTAPLVPVYQSSSACSWVGSYLDNVPNFDYWVSIMSLPGILGVTVDSIPKVNNYIGVSVADTNSWNNRLGQKTKMRVGFCWSGRRDSWLNRHKGMPFEIMLDLIKSNPEYQWISLQADADQECNQELLDHGVTIFPGTISSFKDTAGLISALDVVLSVDTAIAHLSGAIGRPTWIMLNHYAVDWRWLLHRDDSPWYSSARLFRQPKLGDWHSVVQKVSKYLALFKI